MPDNGQGQQQFTPQILDQLSQLFANLKDPNAPSPPLQAAQNPAPAPAPKPIRMGAGGVNLDAPPPSFVLPGASLPGQVPRGAAPSDDPSITMPKLPAQPNFRGQDVLDNRLATRGKIDAINAAHANDSDTYKPHWYDRLLGGATGALVGGLTGNAKQGTDVGRGVTFRGLNRADADRQKALKPLFSQLDAEKEDQPFYKENNDTTQRAYEDQFHSAQEERQQKYGEARINEANAKADRLQDQIDHPKVTDPKNADEALAAASSAKDPNERTRLLKLATDLHKQEIDRAISSRPAKEDKGDKPATKAQFAGVEAKKAAALNKAHNDYTKATRDLDPTDKSPETQRAFQQAHDDFNQAQQEAQDAYEAEGTALGGSFPHQDVTKDWRGSKGQAQAGPSAQPAKGDVTPKASDWKDPGKGLRVKQSNGTIQVWRLDKGTPTLDHVEK